MFSKHGVVLKEELRPGDCGKCALDKQGNWYSHIVAGTPGTNIAYVACASQIVSDIQKRTDIAPSVSPGPRSHKCARDMRDVPKQSDVSGGLCAPTLYAASVGGHEK